VTTLIITGGEVPPFDFLSQLAQMVHYVIAADSGLDICKQAHIEPQLAIGDFDSVSPEACSSFPKEKMLVFPHDKDFSDTELALNAVQRQGATKVILAGGGEGRLDHILAIKALFERPFPINQWHTARESVYLLPAHSTLDAHLPVGSIVSVFPLSKGARGMHSEGLQWPLDGLIWNSSDFGLSNRTSSMHLSICSGNEPILAILPLCTDVWLMQHR